LIRRYPPARDSPNAFAPAPCAIGAPMLDILMLALGLAFFAVAIGYAYVCERL
jgi:hypothetical protein